METGLTNAMEDGHEVEIAAVKAGKYWYFGSMRNVETKEELQGKVKGLIFVGYVKLMSFAFAGAVIGLLAGIFANVATRDISNGWLVGLAVFALFAGVGVFNLKRFYAIKSTTKVFGKNSFA